MKNDILTCKRCGIEFIQRCNRSQFWCSSECQRKAIWQIIKNKTKINKCACGCGELTTRKWAHNHYQKIKEFNYFHTHIKCQAEHPRWGTGKIQKNMLKRSGYLYVHSADDPNADKHGYIPFHRYVYQKYIKRILKKEEVIHHIDGNRLNNKIQNLERFDSNVEHTSLHYASMIIDDKGRFARCAEVISQ